VRSGPWKLHLPHSYLTIARPGLDGSRGSEAWADLPLSLFHLEADPGERMNLVEQYPDVVNQLTIAAAAFDADIKRNQRPSGQLLPGTVKA